ncbi:UNKNOWN [Stylonychia lemnae]|uniref:Proteinase inhibitor I42 chagasin domain-containing protein n=1 Tax=Stylonychia lemnae TaxID=5949 RepID=A0A077ZXE0_STYLE|nr:UNKNOWN [Stylonychia lemnae]|eukprot:CDW74576.1 UNKNOWN [Stylonychia lemnae]
MKSQTSAILLLALVAGISIAQNNHLVIDFEKQAAQRVAITARVGDDIHVTVPGNPTTGFSWQIVPELGYFDGVHVLQNAYTSNQSVVNGRQLDGVGGYFNMIFGVSTAGQKSIELVYLQPWSLKSFKNSNGIVDWNMYFNSNGSSYQRKTIIVNAMQ